MRRGAPGDDFSLRFVESRGRWRILPARPGDWRTPAARIRAVIQGEGLMRYESLAAMRVGTWRDTAMANLRWIATRPRVYMEHRYF